MFTWLNTFVKSKKVQYFNFKQLMPPTLSIPNPIITFVFVLSDHWGGHRPFRDLTKEKLSWEYNLFAFSGTFIWFAVTS